MAKVLNGVETLPKILIAWVGCMIVADRRQTDGRAMTYCERERDFTFAKNDITSVNVRQTHVIQSDRSAVLHNFANLHQF